MGNVKFWDPVTCTQTDSFTGHAADILCMTISPVSLPGRLAMTYINRSIGRHSCLHFRRRPECHAIHSGQDHESGEQIGSQAEHIPLDHVRITAHALTRRPRPRHLAAPYRPSTRIPPSVSYRHRTYPCFRRTRHVAQHGARRARDRNHHKSY